MADEEDVTAQLLRLAGAPAEPAAERRARVRQAVHKAWRTQQRQRVIRRNAVAIAICGIAAALVIAVRENRSQTVPPPAAGGVLATAGRIEGRPIVLGRNSDEPRRLTTAMAVRADDVITTDTASRAALQTAAGSSLRIDRNSRVRLLAPALIELIGGAAYIETAPGSHGFEIRTPIGAVRDVGTQFEVRLDNASLRLRVRSGMVQLRRGATITAAAAGTETIATSAGVTVHELPPYAPEWAWTAALAPRYAIEGRSLAAFLEHTATEEGWTLRYASPDVGSVAERTVLHGSVEGLAAEDALNATVATSGLQYRLRGGELVISR